MTACLVINAARPGSPGHLVAGFSGGRTVKRWRTVCGVILRGVPQGVGNVTCDRCAEGSR